MKSFMKAEIEKTRSEVAQLCSTGKSVATGQGTGAHPDRWGRCHDSQGRCPHENSDANADAGCHQNGQSHKEQRKHVLHFQKSKTQVFCCLSL